MVEQPHPIAAQDRPTPAQPTPDRVAASVEHYRALAAQHLRHRGELNTLMAGLMAGTRPGTVEEFDALSHAHELLTRELGAALVCLGALASCEGTA